MYACILFDFGFGWAWLIWSLVELSFSDLRGRSGSSIYALSFLHLYLPFPDLIAKIFTG